MKKVLKYTFLILLLFLFFGKFNSSCVSTVQNIKAKYHFNKAVQTRHTEFPVLKNNSSHNKKTGEILVNSIYTLSLVEYVTYMNIVASENVILEHFDIKYNPLE